MDVVTANRSDWQRDPFELREEGGYLYGRGTWDDKLDVATITATFLRLRQEKFVPQRDLIIVFTGDEETAMLTAQDLLQHHRELIDAEFCLSGDEGQGVLDEMTGQPLFYQVSGAQKVFAGFTVTVANAGGHSAYPRADNAIYELADALKRIQGYRFPVMWNEWSREGLRQQGPSVGGVVGAAMSQFAQDPDDAAAIRVLSAESEYVGQIGTTCVPTLISGGHASNALPQLASATVNCRVFPGTPLSDVQAQLQKLAGPGAKVSLVESSLESPPSPFRADIMAAVAAAVHATHPGVPLVPHMEVGSGDSAAFRKAGIPTYGVQGLFIKLSQNFTHGLDERMDARSLPYGLTHWHTMLKLLAGTGSGHQPTH
jgi:acetylornithine deacetylase/succinyl-diaminopimelate desuccinylase-like protein